jgi:hypothetical protein
MVKVKSIDDRHDRCSLCWKSFSKSVCNLPESHMHIFNVSIATVQGLKNVSTTVWEELITQSTYVGAVYSKHAGKMTKFNYMEIFSKNVHILPKSHMYIFNVSITTMQGLKNVN